jgi:Mg-chelatase subunit ChlD
VTVSGQVGGKVASLAQQQQEQKAQANRVSNQIFLPELAAENAQTYSPTTTMNSNTFISRYAYLDINKSNEASPARLAADELTPATPAASPEAEIVAGATLSGEPAWVGELRKTPQALLGGDRGVSQDTIGAQTFINRYAYIDIAPQLEELAKRQQTDAGLSQSALPGTQNEWAGTMGNLFYDPSAPFVQKDVAGTASAATLPTQRYFGSRNLIAGGAGGRGGTGGGQQSIGGTIPQAAISAVVAGGGEVGAGGAGGGSSIYLPPASNAPIATTSPVNGSIPPLGDILFGNGASFANGPFIIADHETTNDASNPGVRIRGEGGIILDDAKKDGGVEAEQAQRTASKKLGVADDTNQAIKPEVIKINYASAGGVASALSSLGGSGGIAVGRSASGTDFGASNARSSFQNNLNKIAQNAADAGSFQMLTNTRIIADERVNSVLVFANDGDMKKIEDIIKKLDIAPPQSPHPPPIPQPEVLTSTNIFSTFSLNVSDASFKLAAASLQNGVMPDAAGIRSEEFINAFDYRDPEPAPGAPIGFAWERTGYPFAHNRDLLRFSIKTAAQGRQEGRPLNLVLLLDKSGSMERADRVEIIQQALRVLASQLRAQDTLSVVVFARTARLWVDGVPGSQAGDVAKGLSRLTPEGGTNLEEAMRLAYATALRHYQAKGDNRVVLLTDGAANLGEVNPETLQQKVEANGKQGIALDCFGVGWDGYNDNLMETLSRAGHGRYGFINTPEEAATEFAGKLAGALRVAAADVKVQVEFNPHRVTAYRQLGYAKHQLAQEQFRDNTVAAAQIGAAESGNALYTVEVNPAGDGPLCTVRVRFRLPGTSNFQEHAWDVPYTGTAVALDQASPAMRLAATAAAFSEWLASSPYAGEVTPDQLLADLRGVPEVYGADALPKKLEWMIRQAKSIAGK